MSDGYEMKDLHRSLLIKSRVYLLHNIRPTDLLWGNLIGWQILSTDMVETIRVGRNTQEMFPIFKENRLLFIIQM